MRQCLVTLFAVFLLIPVFSVLAQTTCGGISAPSDIRDPSSAVVTAPITNCDNPFGVTSNDHSFYRMSVDGHDLNQGDTAEVVNGGTTDYHFIGANWRGYIAPVMRLFKLENGDYHFVDTTPIDNPDGTSVMPVLRAGTYTIVTREELLIFSERPFLERLASAIIPTAYAQEYITPIFTFTFTITEKPAEPTGASSVLFLPGIMGSRLYEEGTDCGGSGEHERWFSTSNCDQLRLTTDYTGKSINSIYTKANESSVVATSHFGIDWPLYSSFLSALSSWKSNGTIADYAAVPYDWRMRLDDLLKAKRDPSTGKVTNDIANNFHDGYLYQTLVDLVAHSKSGKVTIVAHSNGGLLAKALMATLQAQHDSILDKIDNVILVAVPQVGTPDAVLGMLQGEDIGPVGLVVSQQTARQLMNTMPFAHHLLPNQSYFSGTGTSVTTPVIRFVNGTVTASWVNTYGQTITSASGLHSFLSKTSGRTVPAWNDLLTPAVVDGYLFSYTDTIEQLMNSWIPASTTNVYEVAGIGIETADGLIYDTGTVCASYLWFVCTSYKPALSYTPHTTFDGDGTVVVPSALAMSTSLPNVRRLWLNLEKYNNDVIVDRVHRDIFEVPDIINFVQDTLLASTSAVYTYLGTTAPTITMGNRLIFTLHSPLDMTLKLASGSVISSTTPMVESANYRRFGEVQYISVPDTTENKTLNLTGLATGSFTLDVAQQHNGSTIKSQTYTAIPSSTSTKVTISVTDGNSIAKLTFSVDYDGNGSPDVSYGATSVVITYSVLRSAVDALRLPVIYKAVLLGTLKIAEDQHQKSLNNNLYKVAERVTLQLLKQQVIAYGKLNLISVNDQKTITNMIDVLLSK